MSNHDNPKAPKPAPALNPQSVGKAEAVPARLGGPSLTSERARANLVAHLRRSGIKNPKVLEAMGQVPRHLFVDEALASRAYEDAALPIGHQQTISKPFTVARFAEYALENREHINTVLEVGAGCGYQAAVFSLLAKNVISIERIEALYQKAKHNLNAAGCKKITVLYGDGLLGKPEQGPFDIIVVAAAGLDIPQALLAQLAIGGRLIVPVAKSAAQKHLQPKPLQPKPQHTTPQPGKPGSAQQQVLMTVDRTGPDEWCHKQRDLVHFVPLLQGTRKV